MRKKKDFNIRTTMYLSLITSFISFGISKIINNNNLLLLTFGTTLLILIITIAIDIINNYRNIVWE